MFRPIAACTASRRSRTAADVIKRPPQLRQRVGATPGPLAACRDISTAVGMHQMLQQGLAGTGGHSFVSSKSACRNRPHSPAKLGWGVPLLCVSIDCTPHVSTQCCGGRLALAEREGRRWFVQYATCFMFLTAITRAVCPPTADTLFWFCFDTVGQCDDTASVRGFGELTGP